MIAAFPDLSSPHRFVSSRTRAALAALCLAAVASLAPGRAGAAVQSCGMLAGCGAPASGTFYVGSMTPAHPTWMVSGGGCGAGCTLAASTGAYGCLYATNFLRAIFTSANNMVSNNCVFDCGTRGSCMIRGADGLPVELLQFGAE